MKKYKHNYMKELWWNRPWKYIPDVIRFMKDYPLTPSGNFWLWIKDSLYLNWQVCLVEVNEDG